MEKIKDNGLVKYTKIAEYFGVPLEEVKKLLEQHSALDNMITKNGLWNILISGALKNNDQLLEIRQKWEETRKRRSRNPIEYGKKQKIIERDNNSCRYCGKKVNVNTRVIDHVIPWSRGGRNGMDNLVVVCKNCNTKKSDYTIDEIGMTLIPLNVGDGLGTK